MPTFPSCVFRALVAGIFLLQLSPLPLAADEYAKRIYQHTVRATGWVRGKNGTGWLLDREQKLFVTSRRHVGSDKSVQVIFPLFKENNLISEREHYVKNATAIAGQVIATDGKRDLALVQLESVPEGVKALKLAGDSPGAGERLHAVANTAASQGLWGYSTGVVRQVYRRKDQLQGTPFDARVIVSQLPINAGDQGCPVMNDKGELVGVATGAVDKARLVTYCVDVAEVREFVAKHVNKDVKLQGGVPQNIGDKQQPGDEPLSANELFQRILPAMLWVVSADAKRPAATGCLVDRQRKLAVTALHVVGKDETVKVWFPAFENGKLIGQRDHYRKKIEPIRARVLHKEPRCGLAVLELTTLPEAAAELKLAPQSAGPTHEVCMVGNPIWTTGLWSYHSGIVRQCFHNKDGRVLETQTPFNTGDAGGPVVNVHGELAGIANLAVPKTKYVTDCIDVAEIRDVLRIAKKEDK